MASNPRLSVLMVESDFAVVDVVREYLEQDEIHWTVEFEAVTRPENSLMRVQEREFDLLIVRYQYSIGTGFDLVSLLREEGIESPVIMIAATDREDVASRASRHDIEQYYPKDDLTPEALRRSLRAIFGEPTEPSPTSV